MSSRAATQRLDANVTTRPAGTAAVPDPKLLVVVQENSEFDSVFNWTEPQDNLREVLVSNDRQRQTRIDFLGEARRNSGSVAQIVFGFDPD